MSAAAIVTALPKASIAKWCGLVSLELLAANRLTEYDRLKTVSIMQDAGLIIPLALLQTNGASNS